MKQNQFNTAQIRFFGSACLFFASVVILFCFASETLLQFFVDALA